MGLLSSIRKGVKKAANAVKKVVNKATDAVADVVETIGNGIGDGLAWLGSKIPGIGPFFGWLGDIVRGLTDLLSSIIKGIGSIGGGLLSGIIKILGGLLTLDWRGMLDGLGDILYGVFGAVVIIGGKAIGLVQVIFTIGRPRKLNELELRILHLVFENSIAAYNVRVVEDWSGLYSITGRPFVLGNLIYLNGLSAASEPGPFAHEFVHVWQNQHEGSADASEALGNQWWGSKYDWEKEANAGKDWEDFEKEAAGEFIEDVYIEGGTVAGIVGNGAFFAEPDESQRVFVFNSVDWTALANGAVRVIRGHTPWRLSELWS